MGALGAWIKRLSSGEYSLVDMTVLPLRAKYIGYTAMYQLRVPFFDRVLDTHEEIWIPEAFQHIDWGAVDGLRRIGHEVRYSLSGTLCDTYIYSVSHPTGGWGKTHQFVCQLDRWGGTYGYCPCNHRRAWPLPCLVKSWWQETEFNLEIEALEPFLKNPSITCGEMANLLIAGAPWER